MASPLNCQGGCGRRVSHEGKVCASCWFPEPDPIQPAPVSSSDIKEQILRAAFVLRFGTEAEQAEAIETLSHFVQSAREGLTKKADQ